MAVMRAPSWLRRPDDLWERALDLGAATVVLVDLVPPVAGGAGPGYLPLVAVAAVCVALRRAAPVTATVLAATATLAVVATPGTPLTCAVLTQICLFSVAVRRTRPTTFAVAAVVVALLVAAVALRSHDPAEDPTVLVVLPWTGLVLGAGLAVRSNRDYVGALEERAAAANAARESETVRRIADERVRIARDLHDAVAHTIAVVNVHAGAAERHLASDPERARDSLQEVRRASRRVLLELRDIVALLRAGEDDATSAPASADAVPALLDRARRLGMPLDASVDLPPRDLDPGVGAAVYRVLQEALTNAQRHGDGAVTVRVGEEDGGLAVHVSNPATHAGPWTESGFGLVGMRERVEQARGRLEVDETDGTFRVRAWLPAARGTDRSDADTPHEGGL